MTLPDWVIRLICEEEFWIAVAYILGVAAGFWTGWIFRGSK